MADKKPPLRLLVVGSSWPPQTFLGRLMRGLSAAGIRVRIAFTRWPNQEWFHRAGLRTFKTREWAGFRLLRVTWLIWLPSAHVGPGGPPVWSIFFLGGFFFFGRPPRSRRH